MNKDDIEITIKSKEFNNKIIIGKDCIMDENNNPLDIINCKKWYDIFNQTCKLLIINSASIINNTTEKMMRFK